MQALQLLDQGGYVISLRIEAGMRIVEAKRTAKTTMSNALSAPLLLALSRNQDEALSHYAGTLYKRIAAGPDDEITIAEYHVCIGNERTSDGLRWVDVLKTYQSERMKKAA